MIKKKHKIYHSVNKYLSDEGNWWQFYSRLTFHRKNSIVSLYSFDQLVRNRRRFELALTRNVQTAGSRRRLSMLDVYFARDGPSIRLKKISRLSVRNGNGILFPRTGGSFRQLADRYLADWVDATRRGALARSSPVIDHEFIGV